MKKGVRRETKNGNERGVNEDGSFHLNAPDFCCNVYSFHFVGAWHTIILVEIEGMSRSLILDTGCNVLKLQPSISRGDMSHHNGTVWCDWRPRY